MTSEVTSNNDDVIMATMDEGPSSNAMDSQIPCENISVESRTSNTMSGRLTMCNDTTKIEMDDDKIHTANKTVMGDLRNSLKELRKFREELDELGKKLLEAQAKFSKEVSIIKNSVDEAVSRDDAEENEVNSGQELHLSGIIVQNWTVAKPKDSLALERVKQICTSLDGDAMYHYEDIDDFDDIDESSCLERKYKVKQIKCNIFIDDNGVFQPAKICMGRRNQGKRGKVNLRRYFLGEIARGKNIIRCCHRGCPNYYDPWDVVRCVDTKDAFLWYDTVAFDPLNKKSSSKVNLKQKSRTSRQDQLGHETSEDVSHDLQQKKKWWQKKKKGPKTPDESPQLINTTPCTDVEVDSELRRYKHECDTCLEGFDEDPDEGSTSCGHYNCRPCLIRYFEEQVSNMLTKIECPRPDCKEEFSPAYILSLLSSELGYSYKHLCKIKKELEMKSKDSHSSGQICPNGRHCTKDTCTCQKGTNNVESWIEKSNAFRLCPSCNTLIEKIRDGSCNFVICSFCGSEFCWICKKIVGEGLHVFQCPLYGDKKFTKKRKIMNYVAFGVGVTIGAPLLSGIILGTGAVLVGTVLAAGALSPPIYMAKDSHEFHKEQNSSARVRTASTIVAGTLGVLCLPFLSAWGIKRTFTNAAKSSFNAFDKWVTESEMEEDSDRPAWTQDTQISRNNASEGSSEPTNNTPSK